MTGAAVSSAHDGRAKAPSGHGREPYRRWIMDASDRPVQTFLFRNEEVPMNSAAGTMECMS